jgi:hypothetical protein
VTGVEGFGIGFVYTPRKPQLYSLNVTTLAILDLCDNTSFEELERRFMALAAAKVDSEETARQHLRSGLEQLQAAGIIELVTDAQVPDVGGVTDDNSMNGG